jgi:hypothetical protein
MPASASGVLSPLVSFGLLFKKWSHSGEVGWMVVYKFGL